MKRTPVAAGGVAGVLVALAVVALASRGDPGDRTAAAFEGAAVGRTVFLSVLGLAFAVSAALALWALWPDGCAAEKPAPRARWLPYLVMAALILVLAQFAPERPAAREGPADEPTAAAPRETDGGEEAPPLSGRASPTASLALTALAVAALAAFTLALQRRRDDVATDDDAAADADQPPALDETVATAVDAGDLRAAIAAVADEPNPRRAVLLAYAVLDAHLAGTAAARVRTSTPNEWLQRIRQVHGATAPETVDAAKRLTALYECARFGEQQLEPAHRDDAVAALRSLEQLPKPGRVHR